MRRIYFLMTVFLLMTFLPLAQANPTGYKESDFSEQELALSKLNPPQKELALKILNAHSCVCGCNKDTWAECIKTDPNCPFSRPVGNKVVDLIKEGKSEDFILGYFAGFQDWVQRSKKDKKEEDPNKVYQLDTMHAPLRGEANAPVTIIEYTDYQCPFCKHVQGVLQAVRSEYRGKVKIYTMNNPLSFHQNALPAALAVRAAGKQGKFEEMHNLIFENTQNLTDETLLKLAGQLGLNIGQFNVDRQNEELKKEILKEQEQALKNGATGTPAFFINGKKLSGAKPLSEFKAAIDKALAETHPAAAK
ncbi:MAG: thioredoxin domain-containing protein [Candidatus Schekmanbacteria bacterium]|nr:thioredoxin domain-containing protein [Candidatus Schekmanbacteria bacterium]